METERVTALVEADGVRIILPTVQVEVSREGAARLRDALNKVLPSLEFDGGSARRIKWVSEAWVNGRNATVATQDGWYQLDTYRLDKNGLPELHRSNRFLSWADALGAGERWTREGFLDTSRATRRDDPELHMLSIMGDVEPVMSGPFEHEKERVEAARDYRRAHGPEDGLYRIDVDAAGKVKVDTFTGGELGDYTRHCVLCNCEATEQRFGFAVCEYHLDHTEDDAPCPTCAANAVQEARE